MRTQNVDRRSFWRQVSNGARKLVALTVAKQSSELFSCYQSFQVVSQGGGRGADASRVSPAGSSLAPQDPSCDVKRVPDIREIFPECDSGLRKSVRLGGIAPP